MKKIRIPLAALFLAVSLFSFGERSEANPGTDHDAQVRTLATVNGVPITGYDMKQSAKRSPHDGKASPEATRTMLETLVRNELIYQQSLELGLDKNPEYRRKLSEAEAELRAFQRREISALYRDYVRRKAVVTDPEAREYFDRNSKRIQTKFHVWQIFHKGERARIAEDHRDLKRGVPFENVASKRFPTLPKGMKTPWDLGYLRWSQIPGPWRGIVDRLEPGQVSDIIEGPNGRFWVIKLVNRVVDPAITFATEKKTLVEELRKQKADDLYDEMLTRMRNKSDIRFPK